MHVLYDALLTSTSSSFLGHKKTEYCASVPLEIALLPGFLMKCWDKVWVYSRTVVYFLPYKEAVYLQGYLLFPFFFSLITGVELWLLSGKQWRDVLELKHLQPFSNFKNKQGLESSQQLQAHTVLVEGPSSLVPSTHIRQLTITCNSTSKGHLPVTSAAPAPVCTHTHTCTRMHN